MTDLPLEEAHRESLEFAREFNRRDVLAGVSASLRDIGERNLQPAGTDGRLRTFLIADIAARRPFSLIRLGDGEGNLLFWANRRTEFPVLAALCMQRIWRVMFGRWREEPPAWDVVSGQLEQAAVGATYVGIPTPVQVNQSITRLVDDDGSLSNVRGDTGIMAVWDWVARQGQFADITRVVAAHVHMSLLAFHRDLIAESGTFSLITCYPELAALLEQETDVPCAEVLVIPPQAANIGSRPQEAQYPEVYLRQCEELAARDRTGQLFLVGAGILGKYYCELIRRAGGMALDVGSLMDVWVGQAVRAYHTPEFVQRHTLRATSDAPV